MKKISVIYLVIFFAVFACKKDNIESNNEDSIQIGNYDKMFVNNYDTLLEGGYNEKKSIDLDIDGDTKNDFKISSEIWGSPGQGQHPEVELMSLNSNSLINGSLVDDTTFYNFQIQSWYGDNGTPFYIQYNTTYSCRRISSKDSIVSTQSNKFKIDYLNSDDYLFKSGEYRSDSIVLTEVWYGTFEGPTPNLTNDTIRYETLIHYSNCNNSIPNDKILNIGIKLINKGEEKIGWIKLGVMEDFKVILLETTIQK